MESTGVRYRGRECFLIAKDSAIAAGDVLAGRGKQLSKGLLDRSELSPKRRKLAHRPQKRLNSTSVQWDIGSHGGALARRRFDRKPSANHLDPFFHADQPKALWILGQKGIPHMK